jgi:hypothetical protein
VNAGRRVGAWWWIAVASIAMLGGTTCIGGDGRATPTPAPHGPFTSADVDAIVSGPRDAIRGTAYVEGVSGMQDLQAFARDDTELAHLRSDGFEVGHLALFFPKDHTIRGVPLTNDSVIVQGITGLFHDAAGAESAMDRYVGDLRSRQLLDPRDVPSDGLGDRAVGLLGSSPDGGHVLIYVWRTDNLILAVAGVGPIEQQRVRALADLVNGRASRRLAA